MKKYLLGCLFFAVFGLHAEHEITIKVRELSINSVKHSYTAAKVFRIKMKNSDTTLVLDTINGMSYTFHIKPVFVTDFSKTEVGFSIGVMNEKLNDVKPDLSGNNIETNKTASKNKNGLLYGFNFAISAKADVGLIPANLSKLSNEPVQLLIEKVEFNLNNKKISTTEWTEPAYLLANIASDTNWTFPKKGKKYGLVKKVVSQTNGSSKNYTIEMYVFEYEEGKSNKIATVKIENVTIGDPVKEVEAQKENLYKIKLEKVSLLGQ